jgi:hypothetical protein
MAEKTRGATAGRTLECGCSFDRHERPFILCDQGSPLLDRLKRARPPLLDDPAFEEGLAEGLRQYREHIRTRRGQRS